MIHALIISLIAFMTIIVQPQEGIQLNGKLGEGEWKGADEYVIDENSKILMLMKGDVLYAAVISKKKIWAHAYLSDGEAVKVMHASAALCAVLYKRNQSTWRTDDTFQFEFRDRVYNAEIEAKMKSYFDTNGWVSNNVNIGDGMVLEFKFNTVEWKGPLYFACVMADYDVKLSFFPASLNDDTILPRLVQGYTPDSLKFEPKVWKKIK